jgi:sporadic carbohydrate cluster protein (TIGR04323 family)
MRIPLINYHGYVTSRPFGGMIIPVPAQNSCLREYVQKQGGVYNLPPLESYYHSCYHQLFGLLRNLPNGESIIMYSLSMLPNIYSDKFDKIKKLSKERNLIYAFVLENFECCLTDRKFTNEASSFELSKLQSNTDILKIYYDEE